jgi:hypothetical protein
MNTKTKPSMTFRELKDFVNTLEDWQLDEPVLASGEERGFGIQSASVLTEDNYVDDYAMQPVSVYEEQEGYPIPESQGWEIIPKGKPYLYFDEWMDSAE